MPWVVPWAACTNSRGAATASNASLMPEPSRPYPVSQVHQISNRDTTRVAIHGPETSARYTARPFHRRFTMTYALDIRGLCKSFDRPAVAGLHLSVRQGEFRSE